MVRNALLTLGIVLAAVIGFQIVYTDDREAVEERLETLFEIAREGGEDAFDEIMASIADDYRGSGSFGRKYVERRLKAALVPAGTTTEIKHGGFSPVVKNDEILVPIVSVQAKIRGNAVRYAFAVTFAQRDGEWKIVNVTRMRLAE
ncbi:MAG: hypothetical protein AAGD14_05225 [Planctomycetota bacterium]